MELLSEIWDKTTDALTAFSEGVSEGLVRLFGSSNERKIRQMRSLVAEINELEPGMTGAVGGRAPGQDRRVASAAAAGESLDDLLPEAFAAARESGRRYLNMRHFDVQLMGGMVLHGGNIAEMVTGEGKDAGRHAGRLSQRAGRPRRSRRDGQRLPGPPRRGMDESAVSRPGHDCRRHPVGYGLHRAPGNVRLRHHLRHQ